MTATTKNLPQLYRFCFLMTGDAAKAQAAFQDTVREAATRAASDEPPPDRLWFFRDARWRCVALGEQGLQAEPGMLEEVEISPTAPMQIEQIEPAQLGLWISGAPEPQRSALALFYLDEFSLSEMVSLLEMKAGEFSELISSGRRQFQSWLDSTVAYYEGETFDAGQV
ncbi:MAG TPA: sigma-70 family RNA polymerase sigma factor [Chthoniobacterales bacterium]|nr:sigma-70 family RNA polymerase sigma factor [Chthoniobacterales bacterium]